MRVTIYTDGASDPNPGIGGWAALLIAGSHEKVLTGNDPQTTNNRMELTAAIEALAALNRRSEIDLYTDSEYVRRGITEWMPAWRERGWVRKGGKPVPNADLWQRLSALVEEHDIEWHWVRGHAGNPHNERVDQLAREARLAITPGLEIDDETPQVYLRSSCLGNPGPGGWGVVIEFDGNSVQNSGGETRTTNNRMELLAAIEALRMTPPGSSIQLFTTSDYLYQGATRWIHGWRKRGWQKRDGSTVANADLWQELDERSRDYRVSWVNAKGRSYDAFDVADRLASAAAKSAAEEASGGKTY